MAQTETTKGARAPSPSPILYKFVRIELGTWSRLMLIKRALRNAHNKKYSWTDVMEEMADQWDLEKS